MRTRCKICAAECEHVFCVCVRRLSSTAVREVQIKESGASPWRDTHLEMASRDVISRDISKQSRKRERVYEEQRERDGCLFSETSWKRQETPTLQPQPPILLFHTNLNPRGFVSRQSPDNLPRFESMGPSRAYGRVTPSPPRFVWSSDRLCGIFRTYNLF